MNELVPDGLVNPTSSHRGVFYYPQDGYPRWQYRYTAAWWLHGPSWEGMVILDTACERNHRTREAAVNCARRLAKLDGLRIEEL